MNIYKLIKEAVEEDLRIIRPQIYPKTLQNAIFLAGPCPRTGKDIDWRDSFIDKLQESGFTGNIVNPTNRNWNDDDPTYYHKQCKWEQDMMKMSSLVVFCINRDKNHPGLTTNIEFGMWCKRPNDIVVCIPPKSENCGYIEHECKFGNIPLFDNYDDLIEFIIKRFKRKQQTFFTSDTHLGAKRTLELSQRPFKDVNDMDMQIVSNWNKKITMNDIVYHLGDFGDSKYLSLLNYKELHILEGNYERDMKSPLILPPDRNIIYHKKPFTIKLSNGTEVLLMHEPANIVKDLDVKKKNLFCFYGHAHRANYKKNGINVGIDSYLDFAPLSEDFCLDRINAVKKYYDNNMLCNVCIY